MNIKKFKKQAYRSERTLMKFLREYNIWAWRVPSSGYKTGKYALPDVIGVNQFDQSTTEILGFEVKCTSKDQRTIRLKKDETPILTWLRNGEEFPILHRGFLFTKFIGRNYWKGKQINEKPKKYRFKREGAEKLPILCEDLQII